MKAILITAAIGLLLASFQQYRIATRDTMIAELKAAVETQNHANDKLADDSKLDNSQAAGRVATVLLEGEKLKRTLPQGTGPVVMNQFMEAVFP